MTAHLHARGVTVSELVTADNLGDDSDQIVGALTVRHYGLATTAIVRVDDVGELYVRLLEDDATANPAIEPLAFGPRDSGSSDIDLS